jgi:hypothetical protein
MIAESWASRQDTGGRFDLLPHPKRHHFGTSPRINLRFPRGVERKWNDRRYGGHFTLGEAGRWATLDSNNG